LVQPEPPLQPWSLLSPHHLSSSTCTGHCLITSSKPCHAVAWHATTMPPSPLAISGPHHRVNPLPLTSLDTLVHSLDQDRACTRQHTRAQWRPEHAHAAPERAWHPLWTRQSDGRLEPLRHLRSPSLASGRAKTPARSWTRPFDRCIAMTLVIVDATQLWPAPSRQASHRH
jgi:hypothetical protein